jgi:hypothetical protein
MEPDLERSTVLRKQVDDMLEAAASRPPVAYVPGRRTESVVTPSAPPMAAHLTDRAQSEQHAESARQQRELLLRQAGEFQRQYEAIDLTAAAVQANADAAAAMRRSAADADAASGRALTKVAALHDDFRAKMLAEGVDVGMPLAEFGVGPADLDAVRRQGASTSNKYADAMDAAKRTRASKGS